MCSVQLVAAFSVDLALACQQSFLQGLPVAGQPDVQRSNTLGWWLGFLKLHDLFRGV